MEPAASIQDTIHLSSSTHVWSTVHGRGFSRYCPPAALVIHPLACTQSLSFLNMPPSIQPGEAYTRDFRPHPRSPPTSKPPSTPLPIRVLQWNIERGYQLQRILQLLTHLTATQPIHILSLQEVDVCCERSGSVDTGEAIAAHLKLNYAYVCEFHELYSDKRTPQLQGGDKAHHGHAVLTTGDFVSVSTVKHAHQPVKWAREGEARGEPRRGQRVTLRTVVSIESTQYLVYNSHFEVFAGLTDRLHTLRDILHDSRASAQPKSTHKQQQHHSDSECQHQLILADCNTMAHSIARLSPNYCTDAYRFRSLGWTEAEWWTHHVWNVRGDDSSGQINERVQAKPGLTQLASGLCNPGFVDPFDSYSDVTLRSYHGLFQGKLDWLLVRRCKVVRVAIGNDEYGASDHKYLLADIVASDKDEWKEMRLTRRWPGVLVCTNSEALYWSVFALCILLIVVLASHLM